MNMMNQLLFFLIWEIPSRGEDWLIQTLFRLQGRFERDISSWERQTSLENEEHTKGKTKKIQANAKKNRFLKIT